MYAIRSYYVVDANPIHEEAGFAREAQARIRRESGWGIPPEVDPAEGWIVDPGLVSYNFV